MRAPSMFVGRASGHSMHGKGIFDRDYLIINRALEPTHGDVIVARIGADFTVKTLAVSGSVRMLKAENPDSTPIRLGDESRSKSGAW